MPIEINYQVVGRFPHDPTAFVQGLVWYDDGFFESTGALFTNSMLRRLDFPSGEIIRSIELADHYFGEGLAMPGNQLVQLTWQSRIGFVYERESFNLIDTFSYECEGWGLTFDGSHLIMSNGTNELIYLETKTYRPVKRLYVTANGRPLPQLNELQFIKGEIWANVWRSDYIVRINPITGVIESYLNCTDICMDRGDSEAVLNGIAYDLENDRIFVTGKLWPHIYEIEISP